MAQTILYYPKINIPDGAWLRSAILYWDHVSSIVPNEDYAYFSPELYYLQQEGIYRPFYPQTVFSSKYADAFCDCAVKRIFAYLMAARNERNGQNEPARIHMDKIYAPVFEKLLEETGLVHCEHTCGWLEIDSRVVQIYIKTLAEYAIRCAEEYTVLGADSNVHQQEIFHSASYRATPQTQCCRISLTNCLPQPALDVSYEDILAFKRRRKPELDAFWDELHALEINLCRAEDPAQIPLYEAQFVTRWERASADLRRVLKEARISFFLAGLFALVASPFCGRLLAQTAGMPIADTVQTGVSMLSVAVDYVYYRKKVGAARENGAFSYLIRAEREGLLRR